MTWERYRGDLCLLSGRKSLCVICSLVGITHILKPCSSYYFYVWLDGEMFQITEGSRIFSWPFKMQST